MVGERPSACHFCLKITIACTGYKMEGLALPASSYCLLHRLISELFTAGFIYSDTQTATPRQRYRLDLFISSVEHEKLVSPRPAPSCGHWNMLSRSLPVLRFRSGSLFRHPAKRELVEPVPPSGKSCLTRTTPLTLRGGDDPVLNTLSTG